MIRMSPSCRFSPTVDSPAERALRRRRVHHTARSALRRRSSGSAAGARVALAVVLFAALPAGAQALIAPFARFEVDLEENELVLWFGYQNFGSSVTILPGPENAVIPGNIFEGQPFGFDPGFHPNRFDFRSPLAERHMITWVVRGSSVAYNSLFEFSYDYVEGMPLHISQTAGLSGTHSHATPGAAFQINPGSEIVGGAEVAIQSDGRLTLAGGTLQANSLTINPGGQWLYLAGDADLGTGLTNRGSAAFIGVNLDQPIHNDAGSTTDIIGDVTFTAPVSGPGAFYGSGTAHFDGGFSPGASPGVVPFEGGVEFGIANLLEIELGGLAAGEFDRLEIAGDVILDGTLDVQLLDAFMPTAGDTFEILDVGGTLSGQFVGLAEGALIEFDTGVPLQLTYIGGDGNDVVLTAVPEPASLLLLLLAAPVAAVRRRI